MTREMAGLDKQIAELVAATSAFKRKAELMQSIKGIGPKTASACLAYLPELGSLTKGEAAAIVGLAPYAKDSGTYEAVATSQAVERMFGLASTWPRFRLCAATRRSAILPRS
jgi:transposase